MGAYIDFRASFMKLSNSRQIDTVHAGSTFLDTTKLKYDTDRAENLGVMIDYQTENDLIKAIKIIKENPIYNELGCKNILEDIINIFVKKFEDFNIENLDFFIIKRTNFPAVCLRNVRENRTYVGISGSLELSEWIYLVDRCVKEVNNIPIILLPISIVAFACLVVYKFI